MLPICQAHFSVFCLWSNVPLTTTHEVDVTTTCLVWMQGWRSRELNGHAQGPAGSEPHGGTDTVGPPLMPPPGWTSHGQSPDLFRSCDRLWSPRPPALVYALLCDFNSTSFFQACFFLKLGSMELRRESYSRVFKEPLYLLLSKLGTLMRFHLQL